jgi:lipid A ethanolaminephosphotransferase
VVGESARADHFSLNGYPKNTNPNLAQQTNLISYSDIDACGTSTAISVPCMFSYSGHDEFSVAKAKFTENILDLLQRSGVDVLWRDNNSSSKDVATRVGYKSFRSPDNNTVCDPECRDVGMLQGLQPFIDAQDGDILIVLHQMGSHGPAYYKRYPVEAEHFKPACHSAELSECSQQEISNAYDNTILYTDYFLSKVIDLLKVNTPHYETTMFYISDHGESLGEGGVFLHGMPYNFAPDAQTKVPLLMWMGESSDISYQESLRLKDMPNSHDMIFSTLLELFEIQTELTIPVKKPLVSLKPEE